ncbi:MAG: helicase-related protein [Thermoproteota archaeon]
MLPHPPEGRAFYDHPLVRAGAVEYRAYQASIAEAAVKGNTLVVLPTALGKTVISALVAANTLYTYRSARVLVMAPTRPLVAQHRESFLRILKIGEEDSAMLTGNTSPEVREVVWKSPARIVFATPQVVRNDLLEGRLTLASFGLLVFDECHRAVKEYAYTDVASFYERQAENPLILAMTASPGSKLERIQEVCSNLSIEQVFYRTEEDEDVRPYVQAIKVDWKKIDLPAEYGILERDLRAMLLDRLRKLSAEGYVRKDLRFVGRKELVELGELLRYRLEASIEEERGRWMRAIVHQSAALTIFHMIELLLSQGPHTLSCFVEKMRAERAEKRSYGILLSEMASAGVLGKLERLKRVPHPKVLQLVKIVKEHIGENRRGRILVFSQYRDTVEYLVKVLEKVEGVSASRFIGQASRFGGRGMSQKEQIQVLDELRDGSVNLLVCTSIAEEGLDIPEVDLVVFYEPIPSEIRYIQRRGRTGRRAPGKVVVLAANNALDLAYLRASSRRLENMRSMMERVRRALSAKTPRPRPPPDPMTQEELSVLERKARYPVEEAGVPFASEAEEAAYREVGRACRALYAKVLEYGGHAKVENLLSDLEVEGYSNAVAEAALRKLIKERRALSPRPGAVEIPRLARGEEYEVTVDKVLKGGAVVWVNGKWRARLAAEDYDGPRSVLKKGASFNALGKLYRAEGVLCLRVYQVVGINAQ